MEFKSMLAGVLLAFGVSNLLRLVGIPFSVQLGFVLFGFDVGTLVLAIISLAIAYYLSSSK
ncbi:Uncharacterised protein [uncultured archaeon]|nr:Uncharacterised protein [uncultured archaeon]